MKTCSHRNCNRCEIGKLPNGMRIKTNYGLGMVIGRTLEHGHHYVVEHGPDFVGTTHNGIQGWDCVTGEDFAGMRYTNIRYIQPSEIVT
jgi:hypothetical protein